jgi:predicted RNA binding protein YcfA (HicA-like mRNA interferase family)
MTPRRRALFLRRSRRVDTNQVPQVPMTPPTPAPINAMAGSDGIAQERLRLPQRASSVYFKAKSGLSPLVRHRRSGRPARKVVPASAVLLSVLGVPKKYREVRASLRQAGWEVLRQRGSHEVWGRPGADVRIVVAGKGSDTVPVGTLSSIRRASGLEHLR